MQYLISLSTGNEGDWAWFAGGPEVAQSSHSSNKAHSQPAENLLCLPPAEHTRGKAPLNSLWALGQLAAPRSPGKGDGEGGKDGKNGDKAKLMRPVGNSSHEAIHSINIYEFPNIHQLLR